MSRPNTDALAQPEVAELSESVQENVSSTPELIRRVVFECNASGADLAQGVIVNIKNASHVFEPKMSSDMTDEEKAEFSEQDFSQGIVTGLKLKSVSSSCPETVTVGMNLFQKEANIANSQGWLYSKEVNDMSENHTHTNEGFTNLVTILPHERQRPNQVVYHPEGLMNSRWIKQYGGYTLEKLHDGITRFKGKDYCYVPENHVVVSIIRNNWEQLGVNLEAESVREGEFMKISNNIVDNCIKQLYNNVILQIPYTTFSDLGARFVSNTEGNSQYKVVCEMEVKYRFP
jgi:hypothetical protein